MSTGEEIVKSFKPAIIIGSILLVLAIALAIIPEDRFDQIIDLIFRGADKAKELKK